MTRHRPKRMIPGSLSTRRGNAWTVNFSDNTTTEIDPSGTVTGAFKLPGRSTRGARRVGG